MTSYIFALCLYLSVQMAAGGNSLRSSQTKISSREDPAAIILPELKPEGIPLEIFSQAVQAAGSSGGIATLDSGCSYGRKNSLYIKGGSTLGEALDKIANTSGSRWQINEGAINMFPAGSIPPLLETKIHRFEWDRTASTRETVGRLVGMPEVLQRARQLGIETGRGEGGATAICIVGDCSPKPKPTPVLETMEDATLLSILNRIAVSHAQAIWTYMEYHCGDKTNYALYMYAE